MTNKIFSFNLNKLVKIFNFFLSNISFLFLICFITLLFNIACNQKANSQSQNLKVKSHLIFNKNFSGKAYVLDGDSIKVNKKEIRLFGIDAPEYSQICLDQNNKEYSCGQISKEFLINLIGGKKIDCYYAEFDKYNRYLSKCFINQKSINLELIKNGMAVVYNFTESDEEMDKFEEMAKLNKIGIWQGSFELPKNYRKKNPNLHKNKF
jgi:endonuclease YncB( thermonuclease family)